ncbi:hypothetical protein [Planktotalea sp.]|nr:hypothetical protein [Planktotalea sp.]
MKPKARFIASVVETAKSDIPALPFARGARRAAFITKRAQDEKTLKSA